jgi:hypothetical protein
MDQIGQPLDVFQRESLHLMLGEREDGCWSAFEFGEVVARQNGKGGIIEPRELGGLFLFGETNIIHSAHQADTAAKAYQRMDNFISGTPWLAKRVLKSIGSPGKEYFKLKSGAVLEYRTRTRGGGRGFSAPVVILDEAQELVAAEIAALMPVMSAMPNPQMLYFGTVKADAYVFRGVVERGRQRIGDRLGYVEYSAPDDADSEDVAARLMANPAAPHRISLEFMQSEYEAFKAAGAEAEWRMERLSIWPPVSQIGTLIGVADWESLTQSFLAPKDARLSVGVAVSPDRAWASVGLAWTVGGVTRLDVARHDAGTDWLLPYLAELVARRPIASVSVDQGGPAGTLLPAMGATRLPVRVADTAAYKVACATFVDAVKHKTVRHRGQPELTVAANGVREHRIGDGFVFARRDSGVLISPLEAVALAAWGLSPDPKKKEFSVVNLADVVAEIEAERREAEGNS